MRIQIVLELIYEHRKGKDIEYIEAAKPKQYKLRIHMRKSVLEERRVEITSRFLLDFLS